MKRAVFRPDAEADFAHATEYYEREQLRLGTKFSDAFQAVTRRLVEMPGLGSNRYAHIVSGLRMLAFRSFPYGIFYFEREKHVEFVRLLHSSRDLPAALQLEVDPSKS